MDVDVDTALACRMGVAARVDTEHLQYIQTLTGNVSSGARLQHQQLGLLVP